jgi:acyl-CoA thioesterase-1
MTPPQKRAILIVGVFVLIALVWLAFKDFQGPQIKNLDSSGTAIVAFGDSLVQGVGATPGNDLFSLLSIQIGQPIINLGKSGDTTADALNRIDSVLAQNPKLVIVLLGGNDYLKRIEQDQTFKNLQTIVKKIQDGGAAVLILGVRGGLLRDTYNARFEDFAKENGTAFVPNVLDGLLGNKELMSDQIHPNDKGYRMIADKVRPILTSILKNME